MDVDVYSQQHHQTFDEKWRFEDTLPVINNVVWNENGKIVLDFGFDVKYRFKIKIFELYYCYIVDIATQKEDILWKRHVANNWRTIQIASTESYNESVDLRIATINAMYDDSKNHNIQLFMKIRCELNHLDWRHTCWTEWSDIFRITSILMPSVFNKVTKIEDILHIIFDENNRTTNTNINTAKQQLSDLYNKYSSTYGVNDKFTEVVIEIAKSYYKRKCSDLLSNKSMTFNQYLIQIEICLNYEKKEFFPFIDNYCTENDIKNITDAILGELVDHNNVNLQKLLKEFKESNNILTKLIVYNEQSVVIGMFVLLCFIFRQVSNNFVLY